jgi:predicted NBD/HSP70 family sugar kinase
MVATSDENAPVGLRRRIIDLLLTRGMLSRAELTRLTRQNKPTISIVVARLISEGLVEEVGSGVSTGGRKPILLTMRGESRLVVGVEIDAAECRFLLASLHGARIETVGLPLPATDLESVVETILSGIDRLFSGRERSALLGCGVAVPGLVDLSKDLVESDARLGWRGVPLRSRLEARLELPVMVTDRGKAAGLGELWVLGKEPAQDLIHLYLGRGVGGAIVLGREIHWGTSYTAGEIGHMTIVPDGKPCGCGSRGCLETLVSTGAILARAKELLASDGDSALGRLLSGANTDLDALAAIGAAARVGDRLALRIVDETGRWIGTALSALVNVLNPAVIVLGGPTAEWGQVLIGAIERELEVRALPVPRRAVRVVTGQARELAAPLGAAALILQRAGDLLTSQSSSRAALGRG